LPPDEERGAGAVKPALGSAIASASPSTSRIVVSGWGLEPVGAGPGAPGIVRQTPASRPSVLLASAVIAISGMA
jgi:hypothetical protein